MTYDEQVEVVAKEIRDAYEQHSILRGRGPLALAWTEMPDERRDKWRRMARAAIAVMRS